MADKTQLEIETEIKNNPDLMFYKYSSTDVSQDFLDKMFPGVFETQAQPSIQKD